MGRRSCGVSPKETRRKDLATKIILLLAHFPKYDPYDDGFH